MSYQKLAPITLLLLLSLGIAVRLNNQVESTGMFVTRSGKLVEVDFERLCQSSLVIDRTRQEDPTIFYGNVTSIVVTDKC